MKKVARTKEYEELVEKLKTGHVYTHGGPFDADNVLSTALLNQVCDNEGIEIPEVHRLFDRDEAGTLAAENVVYGIGGGEFDYHQKDNEVRDNGTPYASFGKLYRVAGEQLHGEFAQTFEKEFVQGIDECTTTERESMYDKMVRDMNPNWDERFSWDEAFANAVRLAEQTMNERVEEIYAGGDIGPDHLSQIEQDIYEQGDERKEASALAAEEKIQNAMENDVFEVTGNDGTTYKVMNFDRPGVPYNKIEEMTEGTEFVGYTFPTREGYAFKPLDQEVLPVPEIWQGQSAENLPEGINYCYEGGITVGCDSLESCQNAINEMVEINDQLIQESEQETAEESVSNMDEEDIAI